MDSYEDVQDGGDDVVFAQVASSSSAMPPLDGYMKTLNAGRSSLSRTDTTIEPPSAQVTGCLKQSFGLSCFRPLQWQIIRAVMFDKRDQCCIMATGYGKSLCYQFPAVYLQQLSVIISPLISLMEDQVRSLNLLGIRACFVGSAQTQKSKVLTELENGKFTVMYMTPEFAQGYGTSFLQHLAATVGIALVAIDEAHCISQWGHDFRDSYRHLGSIRKALPNIPFMAVTATATPQVKDDILKSLFLIKPLITCSGFNRPNLFVEVFLKTKPPSDFEAFLAKDPSTGTVNFIGGATIIYCPTRKKTEVMAKDLQDMGIACQLYHAGLSPAARKDAHDQFSSGACNVIVGTVAFGLGIDKPDIRRVIHYGAPKDLESYYQEIGRAGRDGAQSTCAVYYRRGDFVLNRQFVTEITNAEFRQHKFKMLQKLEEYLMTNECRRRVLLSHFDDSMQEKIETGTFNCCDNCRQNLSSTASVQSAHLSNLTIQPNEDIDFAEEAYLLLRAVTLTEERFGLGIPIGIVRGVKSIRVNESVHDDKIFGAGKHYTTEWWTSFGFLLKMSNFLFEQPIGGNRFGHTVRLSDKARIWLNKAEAVRRTHSNDQPDRLMLKPTFEMIQIMQRQRQKTDAVEAVRSPNKIVAQSDFGVGQIAGPSRVATKQRLLGTVKLNEWKSTKALGFGPIMPATGSVAPELTDVETILFGALVSINNAFCQTSLTCRISDHKLKLLAMLRPDSLAEIEEITGQKLLILSKRIRTEIVLFCKNHRLASDAFFPTETSATIKPVPPEILNKLNQLPREVSESWTLFEHQGKTMEEVMVARNVREVTIVFHLAEAIKIGMPVDIDRLGLSDSVLQQIIDTLRSPAFHSDISQTAKLKVNLPESVTYDQLRIALAILEYEYGVTTSERVAATLPQRQASPNKRSFVVVDDDDDDIDFVPKFQLSSFAATGKVDVEARCERSSGAGGEYVSQLGLDPGSS